MPRAGEVVGDLHQVFVGPLTFGAKGTFGQRPFT
jgi:hypothetical protein